MAGQNSAVEKISAFAETFGQPADAAFARSIDAPTFPIAPSTRRKRQAPPSIPPELRTAITEFTRMIARQFQRQFASDPELKRRVMRLLKSVIPPRPRRRGRPPDPVVTAAIMLHAKLRRQFPKDPPRSIWARVYEMVIPKYAAMTDIEQRSAREDLYLRVTWRRRKRRPRKNRTAISIS
jgi:hypothetical protein